MVALIPSGHGFVYHVSLDLRCNLQGILLGSAGLMLNCPLMYDPFCKHLVSRCNLQGILLGSAGLMLNCPLLYRPVLQALGIFLCRYHLVIVLVHNSMTKSLSSIC
jgi:hypothetical protein